MTRFPKTAALASALLATTASARASAPRTLAFSDQAFSQVVWDGKQYIAFGPTDAVATSPDGNAWTKRSASFPSFHQAASSGSLTIAVDAQILSSTDGLAWTPVTLPSHWVGFSSIAWTGKRFLLNGVFNSVDSVAISEDGKNWSLASLGVGASTRGLPQSCAISPKGIVMAGMGGASFSSDDGATWTKSATATSSIGVVWRDGLFLSATENGGLQTSADGLAWTTQTAIADSLAKLAGGGNLWNEIGDLNGTAYLVGSHAFVSKDGLHWSEDTAFLRLWSMHRAALPTRISNIQPVHGKLFLLGDSGSIWSGTNGSDWSMGSVGATRFHDAAPARTAWCTGRGLVLQLNSEDVVTVEAFSPNGSRHSLATSVRLGTGTHTMALDELKGFTILRVRIGNAAPQSIPVMTRP